MINEALAVLRKARDQKIATVATQGRINVLAELSSLVSAIEHLEKLQAAENKSAKPSKKEAD